ncbi:ThiF family adenylyltransferase [Mammaliicoccus sciuri]|uniref:ThiF family adenylyltransferase n=1 Tax=Mammaliicoccus sciuri TaxID=1296 RepID=UPI003F56C62F
MRIKKTLQPIIKDKYIYFGFEQESVERKIPYTKDNEKIIKFLNNELNFEDLNISKEIFEYKLKEFCDLGLITENNYDKNYRYSRNVNFYEWIDTSNNTDPFKYQNIVEKNTILIVGLGGIGANVAEILCRMGFKNFIILDDDVVDTSNITRQGTYLESDIGASKVDTLSKYLKCINQDVNIKKIVKRIHKLSDLDDLFSTLEFDLSICCADTPKYEIDEWFDIVSKKYNKPYIAGSYASTCINTFCIDTKETVSAVELYEKYGASRVQMLEELNLPTSVIAPITYMAAGLVSYKVFTYITKLNYRTDVVQIDILDWTVERYDIKK